MAEEKSTNYYKFKLAIICMLKRSIIDWNGLNVFYRGTIMKVAEISDQNICLTDIRNTDKKLNLVQEEFMDENLIEILEGGV